MDDPNVKIKAYKRKSLRPWDDVDEFRPSSDETQEVVVPTNKENIKQTISKQLVNNKKTISEQTETISKQQENIKKTISEPIREQVTPLISKQLANQLGNNEIEIGSIADAVSRLFGLQRKLLFYIVENCRSRGLLRTTPVTNELLRKMLDTDPNSVKTSIHRLINKQLVNREKGKRGRGGFSVFIITEEVRNAVLESERQQLNISNQLGNQLVNAISKLSDNNWLTNKETNSSSSSSSFNINTNTTTSDPSNIPIPPEWEEVDLTELHKRNVRFTKNHIQQFFTYLNKYSAFEFQESIDGFVYDIDHGHIRARNGFLNLFIGVITKTNSIYHSSHYISPEQKIFNDVIEKSKLKKIEQEEAQKMLEEEKFNQWLDSIDHKVVKEKLPVHLRVAFMSRDKDAMDWVKENLFLKEVQC